MRSVRPRGVAIVTVVSALLWGAGCQWFGGGPSAARIRNAIDTSLHRRVPSAIGGPILGARDVTVIDIKVIEIGKAQTTASEGQYWPVRVRVEGTYVANWDGSSNRFASETEYLVRKNAYGEWVATHSTREH